MPSEKAPGEEPPASSQQEHLSELISHSLHVARRTRAPRAKRTNASGQSQVRKKGTHGGKRAGTGRKPNISTTLTIKVALQATEDEIALCLGLTPLERRDRLLPTVKPIPVHSHTARTATTTTGTPLTRTTCYLRLTLRHPDDQAAILALSTDERRERLLVGLTS